MEIHVNVLGAVCLWGVNKVNLCNPYFKIGTEDEVNGGFSGYCKTSEVCLSPLLFYALRRIAVYANIE